MATFVNPTITDIPSPVNLDFWVERLKNHLTIVPWLEQSYGKAYREAEMVDGQAYWFPCVYDSAGKYLRLDFNKNIRALSFIYPRDPGTVQDYMVLQNASKLRRELDVVVLYDLRLIQSEVPGYDYDYRFEEVLLADVMQALRYFTVVQVQQIYQEAENVWERFSVPHVEWQTFMHPRGGLRLRIQIDYDESCYLEASVYPPQLLGVVAITANDEILI
jgi:hypothetical protein